VRAEELVNAFVRGGGAKRRGRKSSLGLELVDYVNERGDRQTFVVRSGQGSWLTGLRGVGGQRNFVGIETVAKIYD